MGDELYGLWGVGIAVQMLEFIGESETEDSRGEQRDASNNPATELDAINMGSCKKFE
jgi:hypothetical protein